MNKYEKLIIHDYEDMHELADLMHTIVDSIDDESAYGSVAVYGKSEFIWKMFEILAYKYDVKIGALDINRFYFDDDYGAEYCLRIFDDGMMVIEPAKNEDGEFYCIDGIVFLYQEDCEQDLIDRALEDEACATLFGFDECECCHECDCGLHKCDVAVEENKTTKPDTTTATYLINNKPVSKDEFEKERAELMKRFEKFDDDFTDMLQSSLLLQCSYRDRWNDILRLLW